MRPSRRLSAAALVALGALAAPEAQALVLYEQSDVYDSGNCKFQCSGTEYGAENFVLSSGATVGAMSLWVMLDTDATLTSVNVSWGIWTDSSDLPGSELASGVAAADPVNLGAANATCGENVHGAATALVRLHGDRRVQAALAALQQCAGCFQHRKNTEEARK